MKTTEQDPIALIHELLVTHLWDRSVLNSVSYFSETPLIQLFLNGEDISFILYYNDSLECMFQLYSLQSNDWAFYCCPCIYACRLSAYLNK